MVKRVSLAEYWDLKFLTWLDPLEDLYALVVMESYWDVMLR